MESMQMTRPVVLDGKIDITNCYEGIEGQSVTIQDGTIKIVSSDDGLNAAGGNDQSSMGRLVKILFRKIQMHISISLAEQLKLMQKVTELTVMEISA